MGPTNSVKRGVDEAGVEPYLDDIDWDGDEEDYDVTLIGMAKKKIMMTKLGVFRDEILLVISLKH